MRRWKYNRNNCHGFSFHVSAFNIDLFVKDSFFKTALICNIVNSKMIIRSASIEYEAILEWLVFYNVSQRFSQVRTRWTLKRVVLYTTVAIRIFWRHKWFSLHRVTDTAILKRFILVEFSSDFKLAESDRKYARWLNLFNSRNIGHNIGHV